MPPRRKKKSAEPASRGLAARELASGEAPAEVAELVSEIEADGGSVLGVFRDPLGGRWQVLAGLPIDKVAPTPFQRDVSPAHVGRLAAVIDRLDRFLDPIITVRTPDGTYWTPNGHHRLTALRALGGKSVTALVLPDPDLAYKILALNTEKAHNLREKALETVRMARDLAEKNPEAAETDYALEFEEPAFLTLGLCYEENGRFSGGAYHPVLKKVDGFFDSPLPKALERRKERAQKILELDRAVTEAVSALKERGLQSPYLRAFVVARVNPLRFQKGGSPTFDATVSKMLASARNFKAGSVKMDQLARAGGAPEE
ncbi:MAG TPA: ParB N-terminal domain-containing protein [Thermoanaerobaculia bacterium]|jgi:ParB family chromosome partitioning protein|nr:ParB N-terminal domain-containing protein [Thermoanaerobaculia bacterium]